MTFPERESIKTLYKCTKLYTVMLLIILKHLLLLHLKSIHGYFGLPQHIICTHPHQDMKYSIIHLHVQGLLSGVLSLLTSKTDQMSNSSKVYIWGGSEILPHNCINNYAMLHILQKIYNIYQQCEFNAMTVLVYPIWLCTCIPGICCSNTLPCSMECICHTLTLE